MKPAACIFATLTALAAVFSVRAEAHEASQLWRIIAIGCSALVAATVVGWLAHAPPVRWRPGTAKIVACVVAGLIMLPFAAVVAGLSLVLALPALLAALVFLPGFMSVEHARHTDDGTTHPATQPRHA